MRLNKSFLVLTILITFLLPQTVHAYKPTPKEKTFLSQVQQDTFKYFIDFTNKKTGLVKDSSRVSSPASIASTGFGLIAWALAKENGWASYDESYTVLLKMMLFLRDKAEHENGFFYHMISTRSGKRVWSSEASSIDTALLIAGALYAGDVFKGTEIQQIAGELYDRVDWDWMTNNSDLICHGWKPETGFLPYYWDMYSEHLILQALALGSKTHPVKKSVWNGWERLEDSYQEKQIVFAHSGSMFTYQFSHAYIDFRNLWDQDINYFENSVKATLINQQYCLNNKDAFPSYSEVNWGLSACLGPRGYKAYGSVPGRGLHDGTIAVHAAAGSMPFAPEMTIKTLQNFYDQHKETLYTKYGFKDSFNLEVSWWADEHLGIDQGITLLMIENFLRGTIWNRFMKMDFVKKWIKVCELSSEKNILKKVTAVPAKKVQQEKLIKQLNQTIQLKLDKPKTLSPAPQTPQIKLLEKME